MLTILIQAAILTEWYEMHGFSTQSENKNNQTVSRIATIKEHYNTEENILGMLPNLKHYENGRKYLRNVIKSKANTGSMFQFLCCLKRLPPLAPRFPR
jgi:hypothetical protein